MTLKIYTVNTSCMTVFFVLGKTVIPIESTLK